jgi:hypothetical protein
MCRDITVFLRDYEVAIRAKGGMIIRANRTKIRRVSKFSFEYIRALINVYLRLIGTHCNKEMTPNWVLLNVVFVVTNILCW